MDLNSQERPSTPSLPHWGWMVGFEVLKGAVGLRISVENLLADRHFNLANLLASYSSLYTYHRYKIHCKRNVPVVDPVDIFAISNNLELT